MSVAARLVAAPASSRLCADWSRRTFRPRPPICTTAAPAAAAPQRRSTMTTAAPAGGEAHVWSVQGRGTGSALNAASSLHPCTLASKASCCHQPAAQPAANTQQLHHASTGTPPAPRPPSPPLPPPPAPSRPPHLEAIEHLNAHLRLLRRLKLNHAHSLQNQQHTAAAARTRARNTLQGCTPDGSAGHVRPGAGAAGAAQQHSHPSGIAQQPCAAAAPLITLELPVSLSFMTPAKVTARAGVGARA